MVTSGKAAVSARRATGRPTDATRMRQALRLAAEGRGRTSPNPMVGALVVDANGRIIGRGYHRRAGGPHAEVYALDEAGGAARGATLYCTLEPCCHTGRTGPCTERILAAGIARVVIATEDPNPRVNGGGAARLRAHGIVVEVGIGDRAARRLNESYLTFVRRRRPFVIMKVALSADRRIAAAPGVRTPLTSEAANRRVHRLRAEVDAIAVGSGTVLADDPRLTVRGASRDRPLARVIFDTRLRTPPTAALFETLDVGPVFIVTTESALRSRSARAAALTDAGATLEPLERRSLRRAFRRLGERQIQSMVLEGGARLHAAAWTADLVDRVQIYQTPHRVGARGVAWLDLDELLASLQERRTVACGPDRLIEGVVQHPDEHPEAEANVHWTD